MYEIPHIRRRKMNFTEKIFEKATIRGIADYLLYGVAPEKDNRSYTERLDEPYERLEKVVAKYDKKADSELLDLANEITSETASVYTEIGIQAGLLLMKDMLENISFGKEETVIVNKENEVVCKANQIFIERLYIEWLEQSSQESLREDERYRKIDDEARQRMKDMDTLKLNQEEWKIMDRALSCANERSAEYGRIAYDQGFRTAISLMKK